MAAGVHFRNSLSEERVTWTRPPSPLPTRLPPSPAVLNGLASDPGWHITTTGVPQTVTIPSASLAALFDQAVSRYGASAAIEYYGATISYAQLGSLVDHFARALLSLGVKHGDRVSLCLPNVPQFPIAFFGALKAGAVVVPTNPLYTEPELEHQLNDAGVKVVVVLDTGAAERPRRAPAYARRACHRSGSGRLHAAGALARLQSERDARLARQAPSRPSRAALRAVVPPVQGRDWPDARPPGLRGLRAAGASRWRGSGGPAIHRRHDRRRQGRDAHPPQPRWPMRMQIWAWNELAELERITRRSVSRRSSTSTA